jgi:hypothetical protein
MGRPLHCDSGKSQNPATSLALARLPLLAGQSCYIFAENIEEILSHLGAIHDLLPWLEKDVELYPNKSLEGALQTIYEGYVDFCIAIIRYLAKNPVRMLLLLLLL